MSKRFVLIRFLSIFLAILFVASGTQVLIAAAPTVTTGTTLVVGAREATLTGTVNANGESTTVTFEIGLTTAYGDVYPGVPNQVSGSIDTAVSAMVFELIPNTTYHYRVVGTNASGTTYGADMTFISATPPPTVYTNPATAIGGGNATLNGIVSTTGIETTVEFEYGTDTSYGTTVTADFSPINLPFPLISFPSTKTITGLADNTVYHYRIKATDANGTSYGNDVTFATGTAGTAPTALTTAATSIGTEIATLNGTVNASDFEAIVTFEYGLDTGYGNIAKANPGNVVGTSDTPVNALIGELAPNTTYHYRVVAQNVFGTTNGIDMTFTTLPLKPTATTGAATPVGDTTATLNGAVNANDASTAVTFEYGLDTSYGTTVTADQSPVTGSALTNTTKAISGLTKGVTYHYRIVAVNPGGTTYGADMTFTTGVPAPTAVTNPASAVGNTSALLNGTVNANGSDAVVSFEFGTTAAYGREMNAIPALATGSSATAVSLPVTVLTPNTAYHFRVKAMNAAGTTYGADMTFKTLAAPTVVTNPATSVTISNATLQGTVNANGKSSTITFEYGLTTAYGTTVTADQSPVTGTIDTEASKAITGLTADTVYHYRVVGQNVNGTTYGDDQTFKTTVGAPVATTNAASIVLSDGATLDGLIDANNAETTVTFEYGLDATYGTTVTADQSPLFASLTGAEVSVAISGLANNTTYHYRVVAQNAYGTVNGEDMTFTTSNIPIAVTDAATGIGASFATLNGHAIANITQASVYFEFGTTAAYGQFITANPSTIYDTTMEQITANMTGLLPNTTYHYRIIVMGFGFAYGDDMTFTTSAPPTAVADPAGPVAATTATLNGTVNASGTDTFVTFEYGENLDYGRVITAHQSPVTGVVDTAVSVDATLLTPNTTYHYRIKAQNVNGTVYSSDMTFTTSGGLLPSAVTNAASSISGTGATLNGTVTPNDVGVSVWFEYGADIGYGTTIAASQSPVEGVISIPVSIALTGLASNTTYHYRVAIQNSTGTVYGDDQTFFTVNGTMPTVTTTSASNVGSTIATLNGTINANGDSTTVKFEFGADTSYGRTAPVAQSPISGSTDTPVSTTITDLSPETLYHYRAVGQNSHGTKYGADMTFTTGPTHSIVITSAPVSGITTTSAISGGTVLDDGGAPVTARGVCWSTVPAPTIADNITVDGSGEGTFISSLTSLSPATVYYVRAYATNYLGTVYGDESTFTTNSGPTPVITTTPVTNITIDSAVSGGTVLDDGGAPVTTKGVCWSTAPNPTTADNITVDGSGVGAFISSLTGLSPNTTYFVRAYAVNSFGATYGNQYEFATNSSKLSVKITSPNDGSTVSGTVSIRATAHSTGSEILCVEFYIDGSYLGKDTSAPYQAQWDASSYSEGEYTIRAIARDALDGKSQDTVKVTIAGGEVEPTEIWVNRKKFNFGASGNHSSHPQRMVIRNNGPGTLQWQATASQNWLSCTPSSGTGPSIVNIAVDPSGLETGTFTSTLSISDPNAINSPVNISVTLRVHSAGSTKAPFGSFATPVDGSTVYSSIPVTGWVLDDVGIDTVKIFRESVANEKGSLVYIGDAVLVDGARPDTEEAYPGYPHNYEAGWGYMLLTNSLPNQGNGAYTLHAKATDVEGNTVTLGTKSITCDNANAVKPFGAIDTPAQGGTASGESYVNYGWVLTPQPNEIPTNGSTIKVWVDGIFIGNPKYNIYRSDIADLFPGYANSNGASGYFHLDTTAYDTGVHTIAWTATDTAGNTDCIGSRYFTISNSTSNANATVSTNPDFHTITFAIDRNPPSSPSSRQFLPPVDSLDDEPLPRSADLGGTIEVKELDRVTVDLRMTSSDIQGYLMSNGIARVMPTGTTIDPKTGIFSWTPGPGFVGWYSFKFIIENSGGPNFEKTVEVFIEPKFKLEIIER